MNACTKHLADENFFWVMPCDQEYQSYITAETWIVAGVDIKYRKKDGCKSTCSQCATNSNSKWVYNREGLYHMWDNFWLVQHLTQFPSDISYFDGLLHPFPETRNGGALHAWITNILFLFNQSFLYRKMKDERDCFFSCRILIRFHMGESFF